jgi:hypothetical protein
VSRSAHKEAYRSLTTCCATTSAGSRGGRHHTSGAYRQGSLPRTCSLLTSICRSCTWSVDVQWSSRSSSRSGSLNWDTAPDGSFSLLRKSRTSLRVAMASAGKQDTSAHGRSVQGSEEAQTHKQLECNQDSTRDVAVVACSVCR